MAATISKEKETRMPLYQSVAARCEISKGGFSGEYIFRIQSKGGEYIGASPRHYCFTEDNKQIGPEKLATGRWIKGKVMALLVRSESAKEFLVYLPSGDVLTLSTEQIATAPKGTSPDVSFQP